MSEAEFEMMTPERFFVKLRFFNEQQQEKMRLKVDVVRRQTSLIVNLLAKHPVEMAKLWPVAWDKDASPHAANNLLSEGEMTQLAEKIWESHSI